VTVRGRIAALLEVGTGFHGELTGRENIFLNGSILGMPKKEIVAKLDTIVAFAGVEKFIDTPVIYPISMIPERYQLLIALNPLSGIIETFRASLIPNREIDWYMLGVSSILTVLVVVVGAVYFRNTERTFADVV